MFQGMHNHLTEESPLYVQVRSSWVTVLAAQCKKRRPSVTVGSYSMTDLHIQRIDNCLSVSVKRPFMTKADSKRKHLVAGFLSLSEGESMAHWWGVWG